MNDGVGMLAVAEGALTQLETLTLRLQELSSQAASGTFSLTQRGALQKEADQLVDEYNRIAATTSFNGIIVLDPAKGITNLSFGSGTNNSLDVTVGNLFSQNAIATGGTGSVISGLAGPAEIAVGDINGDSILDLVATNYSAGAGTTFSAVIGNGDGTFRAPANYTVPTAGPYGIQLVDINGDNTLDVITSQPLTLSFSVALGNGDGTFRASSNMSAGGGFNFDIADMNGDGKEDFIYSSAGLDTFAVQLGNGDGTFRQPTAFYASGDQPLQTSARDFNNDGIMDVAVVSQLSDAVLIHFGNGNGTFRAGQTYAAGDGVSRMQIKDLNRDGYLDLVASAAIEGTVNILIANADGSFKARTSYTANSLTSGVELGDFDNDGYWDIFSVGASGFGSFRSGNGDGTFKAQSVTFGIALGAAGAVVADFNNDGVDDYGAAAAAGSSVNVVIASTQKLPTMAKLNILRQEDALDSLDIAKSALIRITNELGSVGANLSRINAATANLQQTILNYQSSSDRILSADVAETSAGLLKFQIIQQTASAVLAQANQQPALALNLLRDV